MDNQEIVIEEVEVVVDVTGEAIEVGTEVTVETEGMIEEEVAVVVGDEGTFLTCTTIE